MITKRQLRRELANARAQISALTNRFESVESTLGLQHWATSYGHSTHRITPDGLLLESRKELFRAVDELRRETAEPPVEVFTPLVTTSGNFEVWLNGDSWSTNIKTLTRAKIVADALRDKWRKGEV